MYLCLHSTQFVLLSLVITMYSTFAWAKTGAGSQFSKVEIWRNKTGEDDVTFDIKFCGICHMDVHTCDNDMGDTKYPCVPGHELAGVVVKVGQNVDKYKVPIIHDLSLDQ